MVSIRFVVNQNQRLQCLRAAQALSALGYQVDRWMDYCRDDDTGNSVRYFKIPIEDVNDVIALLKDDYKVNAEIK